MISASVQNSSFNTHYAAEIARKLELMRAALSDGVTGLRLRGTDWFSWATAGATHTVLLAAETGAAEILVTAEGAWLLTDEIEAQRFIDEELPGRDESAGGYKLFAHPWADSTARDTFVQEVAGGGKILSDKPSTSSDFTELPIPASLIAHKRVMMPSELERYRLVGRLASEAMTEVLLEAQPDWTEYQLAGAGARAMWARGLHPALTLAAGEKRLPLYRHPVPKHEALGRVAMLVFCARGYGLVASLTRFVYFGGLSSEQAKLHQQVREVEAATLDASKPGVSLREVYEAIAQSYTQQGYPQSIQEHHQGGTAGYLAREVIATPTSTDSLAENMVLAWNPSLPGAKVEDTFVLSNGGLENLTLDPNWQSIDVNGRARPLPLER
ncbi:M24 family metallopeptidase [Leptolyngbya sp. FACHB-671]|uniref:M24 family metallopeptidase n=1 Tax=Leptolyngbya sp. FACHB-671 TaxID=2692812 RepID=UPI0016875B06|nr:M24 family metallopeptidase [Leptolyngbya sp. FACHB-671]MBD2068218.1 M24 family metallopeptidase [Leptolyngbya sp. FACHB-671]